jgi:hypothetical protein
MKRSLQTSLVVAAMLVGLSCANAFARQNVRKPVESGGVTGTYKNVLNSLEILQLPDKKVRIRFAGFWPNDRKRAETRNSGTFDETVTLDGKTATVTIKFGEEPCTITLEFRPTRVIVEQGGSLMGCGFGFNVEPDGTYLKISSKPPRLPRQ